MKNRAKCKLCKTTIESFFKDDYIYCKCGEIAISGGHYELRTFAKDYANFLRIDDEGNEIIVQFKESADKEAEEKLEDPPKEVTKEELLNILEEMIKSDESLPQQAHHAPISYYDLLRYMLVISNILKKDNND
jgi:hypothetical protein